MLTADANGIVRGKFRVPEGMPTGTKQVQFVGSNGSYGQSSYTVRGQITTQERRVVNTITEVNQVQTNVVLQRFDPLVQTFTLDSSRHVAGTSY
tara:strand:+ start:121 stop:402 length:282 start_codon:yes stop_codon:yes gene_type:complete